MVPLLVQFSYSWCSQAYTNVNCDGMVNWTLSSNINEAVMLIPRKVMWSMFSSLYIISYLFFLLSYCVMKLEVSLSFMLVYMLRSRKLYLCKWHIYLCYFISCSTYVRMDLLMLFGARMCPWGIELETLNHAPLYLCFHLFILPTFYWNLLLRIMCFI